MKLAKPLTVLILVVVSIIVVSAGYVSLRSSLKMPEAENLKVEKVRIDVKHSVLIGVNVCNVGKEPVEIVHVYLEKIQAKMVVNSKDFSPPISIAPAETRFIALSMPLDPEGADYKLMVITSEKTVVSYIFGYTAPGK